MYSILQFLCIHMYLIFENFKYIALNNSGFKIGHQNLFNCILNMGKSLLENRVALTQILISRLDFSYYYFQIDENSSYINFNLLY